MRKNDRYNLIEQSLYLFFIQCILVINCLFEVVWLAYLRIAILILLHIYRSKLLCVTINVYLSHRSVLTLFLFFDVVQALEMCKYFDCWCLIRSQSWMGNICYKLTYCSVCHFKLEILSSLFNNYAVNLKSVWCLIDGAFNQTVIM